MHPWRWIKKSSEWARGWHFFKPAIHSNHISQLLIDFSLQYGLACRFSKVWRGYPSNLGPWKPQNSQISLEFEGSEAGIMKFLRIMKGLGVVAGQRKESLQGATTARPGSNVMENVRFGRPGALPRTLATYASSRPILLDPAALVPGP